MKEAKKGSDDGIFYGKLEQIAKQNYLLWFSEIINMFYKILLK